jgi:hypothetical protein
VCWQDALLSRKHLHLTLSPLRVGCSTPVSSNNSRTAASNGSSLGKIEPARNQVSLERSSRSNKSLCLRLRHAVRVQRSCQAQHKPCRVNQRRASEAKAKACVDLKRSETNVRGSLLRANYRHKYVLACCCRCKWTKKLERCLTLYFI